MDDLYKPSNKIVENAHINKSKYEEMYKESVSNPNFGVNMENELIGLKIMRK
jgi:hypothetical protein